MISADLSRRSFLRGLGVSLALPGFESLAKVEPKSIPLRMGFAYVPNGVIMENWRPKRLGNEFAFPSALKPLEKTKRDFQILSGLDHTKANANGDGGGDHARASATFLTGCQARKTAGKDIRIGVSVDQGAAESIGKKTKLPSLELSCDAARGSGKCDSGYSCAYQYNLSWKNESVPVPAESNPRLAFERLFGQSQLGVDRKAVQRRVAQDKSVLDFVLEDAKRMSGRLGYDDKEKLEEYLDSVREVESRISGSLRKQDDFSNLERPEGIPDRYRDHIRTMFDLMALAYRSDLTRISTFLLAHDGSNRSFREIGVPEGHHSLSHHREDPVKMRKLSNIDRFYCEQFAYFVTKLAGFKESDGSRLLDHCMVVYGSGISDGNRHRHVDLPVLLAGGKAHGLKTGRHHDFSGKMASLTPGDKEEINRSKEGYGIPMTSLHLGLLAKMGGRADRLGDSTGIADNF